MARKKKKQPETVSSNDWLGTYADCVTLLMTFFILLYSMATVDVQKMRSISQAFNSIFTGNPGESMLEYDLYDGEVPLIGGESEVDELLEEAASEQQKMYKYVKKYIEDEKLGAYVEILENERGIVIQLRDNILFETSSADLRPNSKLLLDKISTLIDELPNNILVEGHTDNRPINTAKFKSNWELSVTRAVNVVRYFTETKGLNAKKFSAAGYGEYHPIAPNDTEANMQKNRRVNILIMSTDGEW